MAAPSYQSAVKTTKINKNPGRYVITYCMAYLPDPEDLDSWPVWICPVPCWWVLSIFEHFLQESILSDTYIWPQMLCVVSRKMTTPQYEQKPVRILMSLSYYDCQQDKNAKLLTGKESIYSTLRRLLVAGSGMSGGHGFFFFFMNFSCWQSVSIIFLYT